MDYLPISKINTFVFCPRRFFYEYCLGINESNYHILEGRYLHESVCLDHGEEAGIWIWSDTLQIIGIVDLIEYEKQTPIPIEYKKGKRGEHECDAVQLCAQGMCLEEQRRVQIQHGYIYYHATHRRQCVLFDAPLRERVRQAIAGMRTAALAPHAPPREVSIKKCEGCSIRSHCQPGLWRI